MIEWIRDMNKQIIWGVLAIVTAIMLGHYVATKHQNKSAEFAEYAKNNHCFVFEYDERSDGRINKRWACQLDENAAEE